MKLKANFLHSKKVALRNSDLNSCPQKQAGCLKVESEQRDI